MSGMQPKLPSKFVTRFCWVTGGYSLGVALWASIVVLVIWPKAIQAAHLLVWALPYYLSGLIAGALGLVVALRSRRYVLVWLALAGLCLCCPLTVLCFIVWFLTS